MQNQFNLDHFKQEVAICEYFVKFHFIASLIGILGYEIRKIAFVIIVNFLSLILSIVGYFALQELNKYKIIFYAVSTSSLLGMILVYQIIEDLFSESYVEDSPSQSSVLFLLTIPYLLDLVSGLLCLKLCYVFTKFPNLEFRKKYDVTKIFNQQIFVIQLDNQQYNDAYLANDLCVICASNEKNIILYKCGHKCMCESCYRTLKKQECPICRQKIIDFMHVYDV